MIRRAVLVAAAAVSLVLGPTAAMAYAVGVPSGQAPAVRVPSGQAPAVGVPAGQARVGVSLTATSPTPGSGVPFTVKVSGAKAHDVVTLTITRHPASGQPPRLMIKTANATGSVNFAVILTEDGTYSLVSTSPTGAVLGSQSVTVSDHGAVIVAGEGASAGATATAPSSTGRASAGTRASDELGFTGFRGSGLAVGGGVLILAGVGLIVAARPRRGEQPAL